MTIRIGLATVLAALALPSAVAHADNQKLFAVVGTNSLVPGTYTYRSDKTKKLRGTLTVRFPG